MTNVERKESELEQLYNEWSKCTKCKLSETRNKIVFGHGNPDADIVVIGIGPGENEDIEGFPFIGESGSIVNGYLAELGVSRDEIFFMNIVACRPYNIVHDHKYGKNREENRDPSMVERETCRPLWREMLYIVDPLIIIAMGKPAILEITDMRSVSMRDVHGLISTCTIPGLVEDIIYPVMCMFHPAYLARSGDDGRGGPWHKVGIAWARTIHFIDQMRHLYRDTPTPNRNISREKMFLINKEEIFK